MASTDRLKAVAVIWGLVALLVGIICTVGGTQVEEVVLSAFLALIALGATVQLSGNDDLNRFRRRDDDEKLKRVPSLPDRAEHLLNMATDAELDALRERLSEEKRQMAS